MASPSEEHDGLPGPTHEEVNWTFLAILLALALLAVLGLAFDRLCCKSPNLWLMFVLLGSYVLLAPGMYFNLFCVNIHGKILAMEVQFTNPPMAESMWSLIHLLWESGGYVGAGFVVIFAMITPVLKLSFLVLAEIWRNSHDSGQRSTAQRCVRFVKAISKWACPDMFAYILLTFLFRHLHNPPLIQSEADLGVGFVCFSIFCICSTFSTLAIHEPAPFENGIAVKRLHPLSRHLFVVAGLLFILCACLLWIGVVTPCMALRLNDRAFIQPTGPVPQAMSGLVDALDLPGKLNADVSVWSCTLALVGWACDGEAIFVIAFTLVTVFAVAIPILDMMAILTATWYACSEKSPSVVAKAQYAMATSQVLRHISMLDVFCAGVFVVCLAGVAYEKVGFVLSLRHGMVPLACAEIIHSAAYHLLLPRIGHLLQASSDEYSRIGNEPFTDLSPGMTELTQQRAKTMPCLSAVNSQQGDERPRTEPILGSFRNLRERENSI